MKICLKLVYCAFLSSSSKDSTMSTPCGVFLYYLLKFKPLDDFFPFQNVIANLCVSVTRVCASVCVCKCVCVHLLNKDFFQAVMGSFYHQCHFQKMVGWVAVKYLFLRWSLNLLKRDGLCLFLSYCYSCSACEIDCKTGHCFLEISKEICKVWRKSLTRAKRAILLQSTVLKSHSLQEGMSCWMCSL